MRAAHTGADDTLKLALVGCGARGTGAVAQALSTSGAVKLWAMADAFEDRMKISLASLAGVEGVKDRVDVAPERQFIGLDAYRKAIDSGVDVVLVAGPPGYRPLHFEYAVKAGKHAFIEKPVATDAPGVRRILAAAEEAKRKGLKVGVGLQRHHDPIYVDLVGRLQQGEIGDITFYRCYWDTAQPAENSRSRTQGLTELEYQVRNWYFFSWLSGDHIVEQHIHNIDVCNWVQNSQPVSAQGIGGRQVRTGKEYGDIFDHHAVEYTYANGAKMFSQCRQIPGCLNQVAEYAHGTRGWCDVSGGIDPTRRRRRSQAAAHVEPARKSTRRPHQPVPAGARRFVRRHSLGQELQRGRGRRPGHAHGHPRPHGDLFGQAGHVGRGLGFAVETDHRRRNLGRPAHTSQARMRTSCRYPVAVPKKGISKAV